MEDWLRERLQLGKDYQRDPSLEAEMNMANLVLPLEEQKNNLIEDSDTDLEDEIIKKIGQNLDKGLRALIKR